MHTPSLSASLGPLRRFRRALAGLGWICLTAALLPCGCNQAPGPELPQLPPRPVSVLPLAATDPAQTTRLTGVVASWKEVEVSFEVGGRLERVIDTNLDVEGDTLVYRDGKTQRVARGTLLAELNALDYQLQVNAAQAERNVLEAEYQASKTELEVLLPQQLREAQARLDYCRQDFQRQKSLQEKGAGRPADLDRAQAEFASEEARQLQVEAGKLTRQARLKAMSAQLERQTERLRHAQLDLERCRLYAPFRGRVAKVHGVPGAVVQPGQPVLTMLVMDPILVKASVSSATERGLHFGDLVTIQAPDRSPPVQGWVHSKETAADPLTRTFQVQVMTRNYKVPEDIPAGLDAERLPIVKGLNPPIQVEPGMGGSWFVNLEGLFRDGEGPFVWASDRRLGEPFSPLLTLRKVRVQTGERLFDLAGYLRFRELTDPGSLTGGTILLAEGVPEGVKEGAQALFVRERWRFRPGEVVKVSLEPNRSPVGFHVPMKMIVLEGRQAHVYVYEAEGDGGTTSPRGPETSRSEASPARAALRGRGTARRIPVRLAGQVGELQLIESAQLRAGMCLIAEGVHYLEPGQAVEVTEEWEQNPLGEILAR